MPGAHLVTSLSRRASRAHICPGSRAGNAPMWSQIRFPNPINDSLPYGVRSKTFCESKQTKKNSIFNLAISFACSENRCILRGIFGASPSSSSFRLDPSLRHIILDVFNLSCPSVLAATAIVRLSRSNFYYDSNNKNKNEKRK